MRSRAGRWCSRRARRPDLTIIARAHSDEEVAHLKRHGAKLVIMGEEEIAKAMITAISGEGSPQAPDGRKLIVTSAHAGLL